MGTRRLRVAYGTALSNEMVGFPKQPVVQTRTDAARILKRDCTSPLGPIGSGHPLRVRFGVNGAGHRGAHWAFWRSPGLGNGHFGVEPSFR